MRSLRIPTGGTRIMRYAVKSQRKYWRTIGRRLIGLNRHVPKQHHRSYSRSATKGGPLKKYLNLLIRGGVTLLCDVRRNAISRKYGFSRTTLERACTGVGIRYEHRPELGIESSRRRGLKTEADFKDLFKEYVQESLPNQNDALERIHRWLRSGESVALTCFEREAGQCHRHCVAIALEEITDQNHPADGDARPFHPLGSVKHL